MNWFKKAADLQKFINDIIEEIEWHINMGKITKIDELIDFVKTNYRDDTSEEECEIMFKAIYERFKNELV